MPEQEQGEQQGDFESLGSDLRSQLERLHVGPGSFLPVAVVEMQRVLSLFSEDQLMHVIVGAAVQVSARDLGMLTPADVIEGALAQAEKAFKSAANELRHLSDDLRLSKPVDVPTLSVALRLLSEQLAAAGQ